MRKQKILLWLKRIGWIGAGLFFLKGLIWVAVFFGISNFFEC
jgi:hypothetical protein